FEKAMLLAPGAGRIDRSQYPDTWGSLPLTYQFEPGTAADGVTVPIPLPLLQAVPADGFDWQVPGLRGDLVTALLRSLPKAVRRNFVPVPDYAAALLDALPAAPSSRALTDELSDHLRRLTGVVVDRRDWAPDQVPDHLRITFRLEDESGAAG